MNYACDDRGWSLHWDSGDKKLHCSRCGEVFADFDDADVEPEIDEEATTENEIG